MPDFDHLVVLMLENHSFDNMAGWLYSPCNPPPFDLVPRGQSFDGLSDKFLSPGKRPAPFPGTF